MSINITFDKHTNVLIATACGTFDAEVDAVSDREIAAACKAGGYRQVLVDIRRCLYATGYR